MKKFNMSKRTKTTLLRFTAALLFAIMVINSTVSIYAFTPKTYTFNEADLAIDDIGGMTDQDSDGGKNEGDDLPDGETDGEDSLNGEAEGDASSGEETDGEDEPTAAPAQMPVAENPAALNENGEMPGDDMGIAPLSLEGEDPEATPETTPTAEPTATPETTPTAEPTATPIPVPEVEASLSQMNGRIVGEGLKELKVEIEYTEAVKEEDTFSFVLTSGKQEFDPTVTSNNDIDQNEDHTITGIGIGIYEFTLGNLNNYRFSIWAKNDDGTNLTFIYNDISVDTETATAVLKVKVDADWQEIPDETEDEEQAVVTEMSGDAVEESAEQISAASASLSKGIAEGAKFVIKEAEDNRSGFEAYISGSGFETADNGLYLFDMQFEKDGEKISIGDQTVSVTLKFQPALFADLEGVEEYWILHAGDKTPLKKIAAEEGGLSEVTFMVSSFSPFAIAAVLKSDESTTERDAKNFDMGSHGWIKDVQVSKNGIPITPTTDVVLEDGDELETIVTYEISDNIRFVYGDTLTYQIPEYLSDLGEVNGEQVQGENGAVAGHYWIDPDKNTLTIHLDEETYIAERDGKFSGGKLVFKGRLDVKKLNTADGEQVTLFGKVNCKVDLGIEKQKLDTAFELTKVHDYQNDKKGYFAYKVIVTAKETDPETVYEEVQVKDAFLASVESNVGYDIVSFSDNVNYAEDKQSFVWNIGTMKSGTSKELCYYIAYDKAGFMGGNIKNTATLTAKDLEGELRDTVEVKGNNDVKLQKNIVKQTFTSNGTPITGNYNWVDHTVEYELVVTAPASNAYEVTGIAVKDAFKNTDGSDQYVIGYQFPNNEDEITDQSATGFTWNVGSLNPGEERTLRYKAEVVDYSGAGEQKAYDGGEYDIWYRDGNKGNETYRLVNGAQLYTLSDSDEEPDKPIGTEKTQTVSFNKTFVWKGARDKGSNGVKVDSENKTVTFQIHANQVNGNSPIMDLTGWQFHDEVSKGWKYDGELEIYAYSAHQDTVKSTDQPAMTFAFDETRGYTLDKDGFIFTNSADGETTSDFTFEIPNDESVKNKYLILLYKIKLVNPENWGNVSYNNGVSFGFGDGKTLTPPKTSVSGTAKFGGGITKEFVERDGDYLIWKSQVTADITKGSNVTDSLLDYKPHVFEMSKEGLAFEISQGGQPLDESKYTLEITSGTHFKLTFKEDFTASRENPIELTYRSKILREKYVSDGYYNLKNGTTLRLLGSDGKEKCWDYDEAEYNYLYHSDIYKSTAGNYLATDGTLGWRIRLNWSGEMTSAVVKETAPEGTVILPDSIKICEKGKNATGEVKILSTSDDQKEVVFEVTGLNPDQSADAYVVIYVATKVTDNEFLMGANGSAGKSFTNKAELLGEDGEPYKSVTATHNVKYNPIEKLGNYDKASGELSYTIIVNSGGNNLLEEKDTVTLVDEMDTMIDVIPGSIVVRDGEGAEITPSINYNPEGVHGFSIVIPDDRKVIITYKAQVNAPLGAQVSINNQAYFYGKETIPGEPVNSNIKFYVVKSGVTLVSNKIVIHKQTRRGDALEGAKFDIFTVGNGGNRSLYQQVTTDENGKAEITGLLSGKLYAYQETKAPDGYAYDSDDIHYFWISDSINTVKPVIPAGVEAEVYQYDAIVKIYNDKPGIAVVKKAENNGTLLSGAEFELSQDGAVIGTAVTDQEGVAHFDDLTAGAAYQLRETKAPENYVKSDEVYTISIDRNGNVSVAGSNGIATGEKITIDQIAYASVEVTNELIKNGIVLQKTGPNKEALSGAEFDLCKEDGTVIGSYTTGENGMIRIKDQLEEGSYYFVETKAPEGYLIRRDANGDVQKISFTIGADYDNVVGIDLGTVVNDPIPEPTPTPGPEETPTPGPEETPTPETTPVPGTTPAPNVTATPGNPPTDDGQVLGANRTRATGLDAAVLGARRGTDYAVLGKRRRPATGDSATLLIWLVVLGAAAGGAITAGTMLTVAKKKKDQ